MIGIPHALINLSLFISFILLFLTSLSLPIINSIWIMRATVKVGGHILSTTDTITFGVWGLCLGGAKTDFIGISNVQPGDCTRPKLGYSPNFSSNKDVTNLVHGSLAKAFVIHPIAATLTFVALILSIFTSIHSHRVRSPNYIDSPSRVRRTLTHHLPTITGIFILLASFFTLTAFSIDLSFDSKANDAAKKSDGVLEVSYGNVVWMVLVAWILQWVAKFASCVAVVKERRRVRKATGRY